MTVLIGTQPEIFLPELEDRPWGRFIDVVPMVDVTVQGTDRTPMGVKLMAEAAMEPIVADFDCTYDVVVKDAGNLGYNEVSSSSFVVFNMLECSTLSGDMSIAGEYARRSARDLVSEALAFAATTQVSVDHLNFADDSTDLGAAATIVDAIGLIEDGLGDRISNKRGFIFIPLRSLASAMAAGVVQRVGSSLLSPAGHRVVADAGHDADVVFGAGQIGWSMTDARMLSGEDGQIDITRNTRTWLSESYGVIVFNPNHAVRSTLTAGAPVFAVTP